MSIELSDLGSLKRSFRVPLGGVISVLVIAGVMMLVPIIGLVDNWWDLSFLPLFFVGLGGIVVFASANEICYQVSVFDHGFVIRSLFKPQVCLWSQVMVMREIYTREYIKVPGAYISHGFARDFEVVRNDNKVFFFKATSLVNGKLLCEYFRAVYRENKIPWEKVQRPF